MNRRFEDIFSGAGPTRRSLIKSAALLAGASILRPAPAFAASTSESQASPAITSKIMNQSTPAVPMPKKMIGFMLAHERFAVSELIKLGVQAEQAGFDLLATSDHLRPWQANEGHSGQAWVTMAALGERTKKIWIGPTVACPSFRYNPAVVAEAYASLSLLYPNRIFLGVGSGEALNEQAAIGKWPAWPERSARLVEATDVIRQM
jgi:F420-dependent hydroxymycolic acid dehydrogenase